MTDFLTYVAAVWFGFVGVAVLLVAIFDKGARPKDSMNLLLVMTTVASMLYTGWSLFNLPG